jgi:predicted molibdopterin-dependent oxidoreductase YjgC
VTVCTPKVSAPGVARPDWMIAVELANRLGFDLGFESVEDISAEIARVAPAYLALDLAAAHGNGVIAPLPGAREATSDVVTEVEETEPVVTVPAQVTANAPTDAPVIPQPDSYSMRLVSGHLLYDSGTLVLNSPSLAKLATGDAVYLHPGEIDRHGLKAGGRVRVVSQRTSLNLEVRESELVARGSAFVPFGQMGGAAAALLDSTELADSGAVKVRLETVTE